MRVFWETGCSELSDGRDGMGRVLTLEIGPFAIALWIVRAR